MQIYNAEHERLGASQNTSRLCPHLYSLGCQKSGCSIQLLTNNQTDESNASQLKKKPQLQSQCNTMRCQSALKQMGSDAAVVAAAVVVLPKAVNVWKRSRDD